MIIKINGKAQEITEINTLEDLVEDKGFNRENIVIEYNFNVAPKTEWAQIRLKADDNVEIVSFVGGG